MKMIRTMHILAAALLLAAAPAAAQPEPPADEAAAARDVLQAMSMREMIPRTMESMLEMQDEEQMSPRVRQMIVDFMNEHFTWEKLEPRYIRIYTDVYTLDELRGLAAFYRTPLGQRVVATMPELGKRSQQVGMEAVQEFLPRLMEAVMEDALKEMEAEEDGENAAPRAKAPVRPRGKP